MKLNSNRKTQLLVKKIKFQKKNKDSKILTRTIIKDSDPKDKIFLI